MLMSPSRGGAVTESHSIDSYLMFHSSRLQANAIFSLQNWRPDGWGPGCASPELGLDLVGRKWVR